MNSPALDTLGLDDGVTTAAGNGGARHGLQLALHATFDAQQDPRVSRAFAGPASSVASTSPG